MPTYEYACRECGQHLEVVQSFTEDPLTTCASCGGQLRKVFSAAGIIFKGSGYYVTDSRTPAGGKKEKTGATDKPAAAASGSDSGGSSSSEGSSGASSSGSPSKAGGSGSSSEGQAKSA